MSTKKKGKGKKTRASEAVVSSGAVTVACSEETKKPGYEIDEIFEGAKKKRKAMEVGQRKVEDGRSGIALGNKAGEVATKKMKMRKKKGGGAFVAPADDEDATKKQKRRKTGDGLAIYSAEELGFGNPDAGG